MLLGYGFVIKAKNEFAKIKKDINLKNTKIIEELFTHF